MPQRPYIVLDDTALLAFGKGNPLLARLVMNREAEAVFAPVLAIHAAGQERPAVVSYVGAFPMEFPPLSYAALVSCWDRSLPPGAAHAVVCAAEIMGHDVFIASTEPGRYAGTGIAVVDLNDG